MEHRNEIDNGKYDSQRNRMENRLFMIMMIRIETILGCKWEICQAVTK